MYKKMYEMHDHGQPKGGRSGDEEMRVVRSA